MKLCKDCKFIRYRMGSIPVCAHPSMGIDQVTGEIDTDYCLGVRRNSNKCGPDGKYFEPIPPKKSLWQRLFG